MRDREKIEWVRLRRKEKRNGETFFLFLLLLFVVVALCVLCDLSLSLSLSLSFHQQQRKIQKNRIQSSSFSSARDFSSQGDQEQKRTTCVQSLSLSIFLCEQYFHDHDRLYLLKAIVQCHYCSFSRKKKRSRFR